MLNSIVDFWSELTGTVHPRDKPVFDRYPDHGFNRDYPPPAFIGDILNAPVIILDNNGGFDPVRTPAEFSDAGAHAEYRERLSAPRPLDLLSRTTSPYYRMRNYAHLLASGQAALVNGVAYRSIDGKAKRVGEMTKTLPSALFHQWWLRQAVLPFVERGERFVVVHRWTRWNGAAEVFRGCRGAIFSSASVSPDLTAQEMGAVKAYLATQRSASS